LVNLSLAGLGVFIFAILRLAPKISNLNNLVYKLDGTLPHLIRTQEFVDELETVAKPQRGEKPVPDRFETFRFDDVQFSYDGSETVLDSFTLSFDGGEFVAFVGSSGAGKSTVVSLLTRLYDPDGGQITVNGTSISEFDLREWRDQIAVVRQDPYIFNDTLYYNLTIGNRDVSRQEVERVCEIAQVTEFLDELENGFETVLGDDGVRLSGGQRQRVAVARALLKDAQVLILDEATSDMDTTLENRVHSEIETMDEDYTMIVIAHRLSTVKNANQIYTLEAGQLAEVGDHDELLRRDGQYAELYANQTEAR
jgi:subfamily B ATP-binding cassette protein MsbA